MLTNTIHLPEKESLSMGVDAKIVVLFKAYCKCSLSGWAWKRLQANGFWFGAFVRHEMQSRSAENYPGFSGRFYRPISSLLRIELACGKEAGHHEVAS